MSESATFWYFCITSMLTTEQVCNTKNNTVSMVNLSTKKVTNVFKTGKAPSQIAVTKNNRYAVTSNYFSDPASLTVIDLKARKVIKNIEIAPFHTPLGLHFVDNEQLLVNCQNSSKILILNLTTYSIIKAIDVTPLKPMHMAVTSMGTLAFVTDRFQREIQALDLRTSKRIKNIKASRKGSEGVCISPDEREVYSINNEEDEASIIQISTLRVISRLKTGKNPARCTFYKKYILISNTKDGTLSVYDSIDRSKVHEITFGNLKVKTLLTFVEGKNTYPLAIGVHGDKAYVSLYYADKIAVINLTEFSVEGYIEGFNRPDGVAFTYQ
jgi:YVTN family beta-propeller protein